MLLQERAGGATLILMLNRLIHADHAASAGGEVSPTLSVMANEPANSSVAATPGVMPTAASDGPPPAPLAHIPLFSPLNEEEQKALFEVMRRERFAANRTIFWMGDRGDALYLVSSGRVAITVPNDKGEHITLDTLGPGGIFGEISLLDGGPRTATIRAIDETEVFSLTRADFHGFIRRRPDVAIDMLSVLGQRQRASTEALRHMKNPNVAFEQQQTVWQRVSDIIASVAASQWFTLFHLTWFGIWIVMNLLAPAGVLPKALGFDPFPFGLLTMVVSLEAIFLSIFVMVSQNRQGEKDRLRIDLDYQVNVKAQTEIMGLSRRLDSIESLLRGPDNLGRP